jgi:3-isopropylmalate/(R)-2-methylmalate dehydratase small subunit
VAAVVAVNYARIFYRNAFNMGLPIFECAAAESLAEGDQIEIEADRGLILRVSDEKTYPIRAVPPFMQELIRAGGLINYMVSRRDGRERDKT